MCERLTPSEAAEKLTPDFREVLTWLDNMQSRLVRSLERGLDLARQNVDFLATREVLQFPVRRFQTAGIELDELEARLQRAARAGLDRSSSRIRELAGRLKNVDPLGVLARGFSLTSRGEELVTSIQHVNKGDQISTRTTDGTIVSQVIGKTKQERELDESGS